MTLSLTDRFQHLWKHKLCIDCLKGDHLSSSYSLRVDTKCSKKYKTLVHFNPRKEALSSGLTQGLEKNSSSRKRLKGAAHEKATVAAVSTDKLDSYVFLRTALVNVKGLDGTTVSCRAILDSGYQVNIVSDRLLQKLHKYTTSM